MSAVDLILNIAAVFLWMEWRSARSAKPQSVLSIGGTIRAAGHSAGPGIGSLVGLFLLLLVRPAFYYTVGSAVNWMPALDFLAISIPWRSDFLGRMYIFSTLTFLKAAGYYYVWLLLLSAVNRNLPDDDLLQRFVRGQLGWLEKVPWWFKLLLPSVAAGLAWAGLVQLLLKLELLPPGAGMNVFGQAAAFAVAALLAWKWFLIALFLVHLLNVYLYIGTHPVWGYIGVTSRKLLLPFKFLRFGKLDLSPLFGAVAVFTLSRWVVEPLVVNMFRTYYMQ